MNTRDLRIDDFVYYADKKCKIREITRSQVEELTKKIPVRDKIQVST